MSIPEPFNRDLAGRRILVVEDDLIVAQVIISVLRELGCEVVGPVVNATAVWESISDFPPDLVLMDIGIEGAQDGIDTAAMIREQFDVPVVFLTSASEPEVIDRAQQVDPLGYLLKPIKPIALRSTVEVALWRDGLERRAREREHWISSTLQVIGDAVITADENGLVTYLNPQAERMLGRTLAAVQGSRIVDLVKLTDENSGSTIDIMSPSTNGAHAQLQPIDNRSSIPVEHTIAPIVAERNVRLGWVLSIRDVTERRKHEREVQRLNTELMNQSVVDELTQLSNRRGLMVLAEHQIRAAARSHAPLTVLFVGLNGMSFINDTYGHVAGDQALCDIAAILRSTLRNCDILSRLGGDEFVVVAATEQAARLQQRIRDAVNAHNQASQRDYTLSVSIGAAIHWPAATADSADVIFARLLAAADSAMYDEKQALHKVHEA